jgi:site-specific DNA recombinase
MKQVKHQSSNGSDPWNQPHRVAMYARVSSEDQAERGSIDNQRDFLRNFTQLYQMTVTDEYCDDGVSGTLPLPERAAGRRLLDDAKAGVFQTVLVYRLDRLGRSLKALLDAHTVLEQAGVTIRSATEPFDTSTSMGIFVFQLLASLAQLETSTIKERMSLGRDRKVRNGRWTGGPIPIGYDLDAEGKLTPSARIIASLNCTEADLVREIFQRIAQGGTAIDECRRLDALGVPTGRRYAGGKLTVIGTLWRPSRLTYILRNPVYIGQHVFQSRFGSSERRVPALIDRQVWERADAQLKQNRCLPKWNAKRTNLLRNLITCGLCGRSYVGMPNYSPKGISRDKYSRYYYRCGTQTISKKLNPAIEERCPAKLIRADWLEARVWSNCRNIIENPGEALAEARRKLQERVSQNARLEEQRARYQEQLAEKGQARDRILSLVRRGSVRMDEAEAHLELISKEERDLRDRLQALQTQRELTDAFDAHVHEAEATLALLREELTIAEATNDLDRKRRLIEKLIVGITVETTGTKRRKHATIRIRTWLGPEHITNFNTSLPSR